MLYFNGATTFLRPHDKSQPTLSITHSTAVQAVKFSHGYTQFASIEQKGTLLIYNINNDGTLTEFKRIDGFYVGAKAMDWTSDGKRICVVGNNNQGIYARIVII